MTELPDISAIEHETSYLGMEAPPLLPLASSRQIERREKPVCTARFTKKQREDLSFELENHLLSLNDSITR
jgi:hypothetical protein